MTFGSPQSDNGDFFDLYRRSTVDVYDMPCDFPHEKHTTEDSVDSGFQSSDSVAEHLGNLMADLSSLSASTKVSPRKLSYPTIDLKSGGIATQLRKRSEQSDMLQPSPTSPTSVSAPQSRSSSITGSVQPSLPVSGSFQDTRFTPSVQLNATISAHLEPGFRFPAPQSISLARVVPVKHRPTPLQMKEQSTYPALEGDSGPSPYNSYHQTPHSASSLSSYNTVHSMPTSPYGSNRSRIGFLQPRPSFDSRTIPVISKSDRLTRLEMTSPTNSNLSSLSLPRTIAHESPLMRSQKDDFELVPTPIFTYCPAEYEGGQVHNASEPDVSKQDLKIRTQLRLSMMVEDQYFIESPGLPLSPLRPSRDSSRSARSSNTLQGPKNAKAASTYRAREQQWLKLMAVKKQTGSLAKKNKVLKKLVRVSYMFSARHTSRSNVCFSQLGIPSSVRSKAWCYMANVSELRKDGLYLRFGFTRRFS